jgi:glyoxylate utilization-related uncharacterized protein
MKRYDAISMDLMEGWLGSGLAFNLRTQFAMRGPEGARRSAVQFVQLEEGEQLAGEVDGQETMLLVIDGEVEIDTGRDRHISDRGSVAIVPPFMAYTVRNSGRRPAHLLCVQPQAAVDSVFVAPLQPLAIQLLPRDGASRGALAG